MCRVTRIAFNEFSPSDKVFMPVNQVVDGDGVKPLFGQFFAAMGTDISGTKIFIAVSLL
jgi:hypothetical protein